MPTQYQSVAAFSALLTFASAQSSLYQPCPLLGPFVPTPRIDPSSPVLQSALGDFKAYIDTYVHGADGDLGPITPNTTSFSIALFAGSNYVAGDDAPPFFFDYDHTASSASPSGANESLTSINASDSVYALGSLTQLFTVYALLAELGDGVWHRSITDYLPELQRTYYDANTTSLYQVQWEDVTLGALAGHMASIARDSDACRVDEPCALNHFLRRLNEKSPVYLPDTTPVFSNAAFQLLAYTLERETTRPFEVILRDALIKPLDLNNTGLLSSNTSGLGHKLTKSTLIGEPASLGMYSTITDLSAIGRAMLTNQLLSPAQTRRWLKPITSTSNLRNAVGRPWEIYHYGNNVTDPVVDIYTKTGTIGPYSSYFGLASDYDIGFVILAVDEGGSAPDLNAYADIALAALLEIDQLARAQANDTLVGTYASVNNLSTVTLQLTGDNPGLAITALIVNGTDWLTRIANMAGIPSVEDMDFRLYPTNLEQEVRNGPKMQAFRGVVQDKGALVDAGTPTCISWMTVDVLQYDGLPLDEFVFMTDEQGKASAVVSPALGVELARVRV